MRLRYVCLMGARNQSRSARGYPAAFVDEVLADALSLAKREPAVYGIVGLQGTGKSTLSAQVAALAASREMSVVVLSIDDFYLGRRERLRLGRMVHPLLTTRGPPGTHDVALACATIDALVHFNDAKPVLLPRFDKITDRRLPPSRWRRVTRAPDLIILEGWFLQVPPEPDVGLQTPLNALERIEDPRGIWRRYVNAALANDYARLWQRIDRLLYLQGPGFDVVPRWRWQQEVTLQSMRPTRRAMNRDQVERFVLFFERVSRQALRTLPAIAQRTVGIDVNRLPIAY